MLLVLRAGLAEWDLNPSSAEHVTNRFIAAM